KNQDVFPKDDDGCVEEIVERNAPGAFCSPQSCAQANQPRSVVKPALVASSHRNGLTALSLDGQRPCKTAAKMVATRNISDLTVNRITIYGVTMLPCSAVCFMFGFCFLVWRLPAS